MLQISYFYICASFRENEFSFRSWLLKNTVFNLSFNSYTSKIVHIFVICVDFWSHIFGLQFIYMNLFLWNLLKFNWVFMDLTSWFLNPMNWVFGLFTADRPIEQSMAHRLGGRPMCTEHVHIQNLGSIDRPIDRIKERSTDRSTNWLT